MDIKIGFAAQLFAVVAEARLRYPAASRHFTSAMLAKRAFVFGHNIDFVFHYMTYCFLYYHAIYI